MREVKSGFRSIAPIRAGLLIIIVIFILISFGCNKRDRTIGSNNENVPSVREGAIDGTARSGGMSDGGPDNPEAVTPYEVSHGLDVYLGQNCASCHRIGDEGGDIGTDLTYIGKRLTPDEIRGRIVNPLAGSSMESHSFEFADEKDLEDLVKYLSMLK